MSETLHLEKDIARIANRLIETRPEAEVIRRPFRHNDFQSLYAWGTTIHPKKYFRAHGGCKAGDTFYVVVDFLVGKDDDVHATSKGTLSLFYEGKEYAAEPDEQGRRSVPLHFRKGYNRIIFRGVIEDERDELTYMVGQHWMGMARDYILWVRDTIPMEEYVGETGFAMTELIPAGVDKKPEEVSFVYPTASLPDSHVDLNDLYGGEKGKFATSMTMAAKAGEVSFKPLGKIALYVNGAFVEGNTVSVLAGDLITVVSEKTEKGFGFDADTANLSFPIGISHRKGVFVHIGSFDAPSFPPLEYVQPVKNANGEEVIWRLTEKDSFLRPYLDTCFYGQWFYALMVGQYGLLHSTDFYEKAPAYFDGSIGTMIKYFRYMQVEKKIFGDAAFLRKGTVLDNLDAIGTIGMNFYEFYLRHPERKDTLNALHVLCEAAMHDIPRRPDGTFYRINTMWADDTFMSTPFLSRYGLLTGDETYTNEAVDQLLHYRDYLFMEDQNIFAHIWFPDLGRNNRVPWGRGNGWVLLATAEVLEHIPQDQPRRKELEEMFVRFAGGLKALQDQSGLWHQVLNLERSYLETSCTAIYTIAFCKGIKLGLLDKAEFKDTILRAVNGLLAQSVSEKGDVLHVCRGSSCKDDPEYYVQLGTIDNDDHGTGVVLLALSETQKMYGND